MSRDRPRTWLVETWRFQPVRASPASARGGSRLLRDFLGSRKECDRGPGGLLGLYAVQRLRLIAVTVGLAALFAVAVPGVGSSAKRPHQACGREEFVSGLEVVFGRFKTEAQAQAYRRKVLANGFENANIIPGCDFRVVVRGIETFDIAVELQNEARRVKYNVTIECIKAKELGRIEAIFGHGRDRAAAQAIVNHAADFGYVGLKLRPDPCGGFEVYLAGFKDRAEAETFRQQARDRGVDVVLERN